MVEMATTTNGHTNGDTNGHADTDKTDFTLKQAYAENLRPLRVVVIGAGYSGIGAAIR